MTPALLIRDARAAGLLLWHEAGRVRYYGRRSVVVSVLPRLTEHKAGVAETLRLEAVTEAFEERAAILEFEAGLSRDGAEAAARLRMFGSS